MQLLAGSNTNLSGNDIHKLCGFLTKNLGFMAADFHGVNGDWVITAEGREPVVAKTRKPKEAAPSGPADAE